MWKSGRSWRANELERNSPNARHSIDAWLEIIENSKNQLNQM